MTNPGSSARPERRRVLAAILRGAVLLLGLAGATWAGASARTAGGDNSDHATKRSCPECCKPCCADCCAADSR